MRQRAENMNWKLLWAIVLCIVIFIATFAVVVSVRDKDISRVERQAELNRALIERVASLERRGQKAAYDECVAANKNSTRSRKLLDDLTMVGDPQERAIWKKWNSAIPAGGRDCKKLKPK
jgi:hypothetical protein